MAELDEVQAIIAKMKEAASDIDTAISKYSSLVGELKKYSRKSPQTLPYGMYANECSRMSGGLSMQLRKSAQLDRVLDRIHANRAEEERLEALREAAKQKREAKRQRYSHTPWLPPVDSSFDELYSDVVDKT